MNLHALMVKMYFNLKIRKLKHEGIKVVKGRINSDMNRKINLSFRIFFIDFIEIFNRIRMCPL